MGIEPAPRFFGGACTRSPVLWRRCVLWLGAALLLAGCATTKDRGDRAFEAQQYSQALDHYEVAMEKGSRDAGLYFRAAEAALKIGDFSLAERFYSRSLRYGGGEKVARSLAEFYIATSNYTKAVRVLQELLETTANPQSVFNNLGAALMYAGLPLDAESYLLVAQQMRPSDPVPYVNLGVLYDRHMRQPHLALGFYRCFLELSTTGGQRRKIESRVKALEMRHGQETQERFKVACDRPYQPPTAPSEREVRETLGEGESEGDVDGQEKQAPVPNDKPENLGVGGDEEDDKDAPPPVIYRQVDDLPSDTKPEPDDAPSDKTSPGETLRLAEQAFSEDNHMDVIRHLETLPTSALDARAMALYGRSLAEIGAYERAQKWLAGAVAEEATPENVAALMQVYRKLGATEKLNELCARFEDDDALESVLARCPKRQLLEHLKNKQQ